MRKAIAILFVGFLIGAPTVVLAAKVTAVPAAVAKKWNINTKFYKKYIQAYGVPLVSSANVDSRELLKGIASMRMMMGNKKFKTAKYLKKYRGKMAIVDEGRNFSDMPEAKSIKGRGKKYNKYAGLACCGKYKLDSKTEKWKLYYRTGFSREKYNQSILQHEFAHVIHLGVINNQYPSISKKISKAYKAKKKKGDWKDSYAMTNDREYWAVGSSLFFLRNKNYAYNRGWPRYHEELPNFDRALYNILLKVYGNSKLRVNALRYTKTTFSLSTPFGAALTKAASQNMFMVGEDFDLKIHANPSIFSFQDYQYIGVDDPAKSAFKLGVKGSVKGDTPNMGGNFALTHQGEEFTYKVAADETFLGSKGGGWLSYDNAQSLYVNVGRNFDLGNNWTAQGDLTYGVAQAKARKDSVFQDYSTVHAMGFDVSATYGWTDNDSIQLSASSPLRVEQGSLVIESPYDQERVQLSPNARQLDYGVAYTRKFKTAALTTTLQFTEDSGHYQGQDTTRVMAEYSLSF